MTSSEDMVDAPTYRDPKTVTETAALQDDQDEEISKRPSFMVKGKQSAGGLQ